MAGYYRKFVRNFGALSKPLTQLLRKGVPFKWSPEADKAFLTLKETLVSAPVLALPDFFKTFTVETDACDVGIGAVLSQDKHPIAFVSRALGPKTKGLSTYEKEYLAIMLAVDQWRSYLQHGEFIILTDHHSLMHLSEQRLHTPWQHKAFTKLLGSHYKICYRKGTSNAAADALSRKEEEEEVSLFALSECQPVWLQSVLQGYNEDAYSKQLITELSIDPSAKEHFQLFQGLLKFKGRIWLGQNTSLQQQVFSALHASPIGGHSGFPVTYRRIKNLFAWPQMKSLIRQWVKECVTCQQAKPDRAKYPGLLQPLPVPAGAWQVVTLDFIEGLPRSHGFNCILVVVDKFSKYAHFIALSHPFTSFDVATAYMRNIYKLHGLPRVLISDRDKIFTSKLWEHLFQKSGTELHLSSAYHPQSDGQTERVNQCLEMFLRCFVHAAPSKWESWLHLAEYWYNTCYHSALDKTPFQVLYGHSPSQLGITTESCMLPDLNTWLQERQLMTELLQQHLHRVQQKMKLHADKHRSFRAFCVGDWVFLKLQPYVQKSVSTRACHKLSFKYYGPFQVLDKIGTVAYKLQLPEYSAIHLCFMFLN